jgi:putative tricarboxylic transport membrane protein
MTISQGDTTVFLTRPISATLVALTVLALVVPVLLRWRSRTQENASTPNAPTCEPKPL